MLILSTGSVLQACNRTALNKHQFFRVRMSWPFDFDFDFDSLFRHCYIDRALIFSPTS